jgi:hypothetical protein
MVDISDNNLLPDSVQPAMFEVSSMAARYPSASIEDLTREPRHI